MVAYVAGDILKDFSGDYDGATCYGGYALRVNVSLQRSSPAIVMRTIPLKVPPFESLLLPPMIATFAEFPRGLVLVCGPTGSGKSTTLASIIDRINRSRPCHIITIEDPIEYMHPSGVRWFASVRSASTRCRSLVASSRPCAWTPT